MKEYGKKDRKKLTKGPRESDNHKTAEVTLGASNPDRRIVALVQFLARRAARQDFAKQLELSRLSEPRIGDTEGIQ